MFNLDIRLFEQHMSTMLAGRYLGQFDMQILRNMLQTCPAERIVVTLDFSDIVAMTPSYFKAALFPIWAEFGRERELFPIAKHFRGGVEEDLRVAMDWCGISMWEAIVSKNMPTEYIPFGKLEGPLQETLSIVMELRNVTAGSLWERHRKITTTAWNNRLADLYDLRMLTRRKEGRQLVYALPWLLEAPANHAAPQNHA